MRYVPASEVLKTFARYLEDTSGDYISKEAAIENLMDAIDSVDCVERE